MSVRLEETDLISALGLGERELIALVGGGGKTALMFSIAEVLVGRGCRVATTTTTKVRHREAYQAPVVVFSRGISAWKDRVREGLERYGLVFVAESVKDSSKVHGIDPSAADDLFQCRWLDHVIVEADGSAGRPLKAPEDHEPVIPCTTTMVVALMGLEALGRPFGEGLVFRPERVTRLTGLRPGERILAERLGALFEHPNGLFKGSPGSARRVALLNKLDLLIDRTQAVNLAALLLGEPHNAVERVVMGSVLKGHYLVAGEKR